MDATAPPTRTARLQELAIVVTGKTLSPTSIAPDLLKSSGVIPSDWELSRQPQFSQTQGRLAFQNGLSVVAQNRSVTFAEALKSDGDAPVGPSTTRRFVEWLPNAEYQSVAVAPKLICGYPNQPTAPRDFILGLLAPEPWQNVGTAPPRATLNLVFPLDRAQLSLSVAEVALRPPESQESVPALLFSGSFTYAIAPGTAAERGQQLQTCIANWQRDFTEFTQLIDGKFLGKVENSIFPAGAVPS